MEEFVCDTLQKVDMNDDGGFTELHEAALYNDVPKLKNLLSLGEDVNLRDKFKRTPLYWAAMSKDDCNLEAIRVLLENGADVNAQCNTRKTPLHALLFWGRNSLKSAELILKYKPNLSIIGSENETTLSRAIRSNNYEILKLIVRSGADVNFMDFYGATPLHEACYRADMKIVKYLAKHGADFYTFERIGGTPLELLLIGDTDKYQARMKFVLKYSYIDLINQDQIDHEIIRIFKSGLYKIILQHAAILYELNCIQGNLSVLKTVYESQNRDEKLEDYFQQCKDELSAAKNLKLKNSWITYFNLLVGTKRNLKNYAGNEDLMSDFKNSDCLVKFPIFGAEMQKNVEKGIKRRELFDKSSIILSDCLPIFNPTHLIIRGILDFLTTKNLSKLC